MTRDPQRWSERSEAPELQELMRDARRRAPSPADLERLLGKVEATVAAPAPAGRLAKLSLGALAVVGLGSVVAAGLWPRHEAPPAVPSVAVASARAPVAPSVPGVVPPTAPVEPPRKVEAPRASKKTAAPSPSSAPSELELIRAARAALATDPTRALDLATEHAKLFPAGALAQEREVIAIEALVGLARTAEGRVRAEAFVARHPGSAYVLRLERAVGTLSEGDSEKTPADQKN